MFLLHYGALHAQNCGAAALNQFVDDTYPYLKALHLKADSILNTGSPSLAVQGNNGPAPIVVNGIHYLPVVVHVINRGEPLGSFYNPTDQQIMDMINSANQALAGTFPGYPTPATGGQDITIQLVLAQRTPDCNPTNGIVRVNAMDVLPPPLAAQYNSFGLAYPIVNPNGISQADLATMSYWPNLDYINIWMVHMGVSSGYYPTGTATVYDGIILGVGNATTGGTNPYVLTHELGHYFGLRHTDEGGPGNTCPVNNNCATDGDFICDTDPVPENIIGCNPAAINPCTTLPLGNLVYNYMGNTCNTGNIFTAGQKTRMLNSLINLRSALDTSLGGTSLALVPLGPPVGPPTINISTGLPTYCIGSTIIFDATTTNAGVSPTYQWKVNGINAGTNYPQFVSTTLNNGDIVTCDLTPSYAGVCQASGGTVTSNPITISLNSTQAPSIVVSPASTLMCSGAVATFNAVAANTGPYIPFFEWYVNGYSTGTQTGSGALTSSYSYTPANGDVVSCRLYANAGCNVSPFIFSNGVTVSLTPSIVPSVSVTIDTNHICSGGTIMVTATPVNGGTGSQVYWYINSGLTVASGLGPLPLTLTDTCQVYAVLAATGTCVSLPYAFSPPVTIYVDSVLNASVAISASDTNFCPGAAVSLAATDTNGGANPVYNWMVNGNSAGTGGNSFSYAPADGDVVNCILTSSYACLNTNPVTSNGITLHEQDTVTATIMFLKGNNSFCEGDTIILSATLNNLDTNVVNSRRWTVNGNTISAGDTVMYILVAGNNVLSFTTDFAYPPHCMTGSEITFFTTTIIASPQPAPAIVTDFGTYLKSNYPDGQNQWYAVGMGALAGETNQLFYPSFSGQFYDIVHIGNCYGKSSDTLQFQAPNSVNNIMQEEGVFYPNPSANGRFITPQQLIGKEAVIFDNLGAVIRTLTLEQELSLEQEAAGVYSLKVVSDHGTRVYRLAIMR